jgi:hypothetical protein
MTAEKNCKQPKPDLSDFDTSDESKSNRVPYKEPSEDSKFYGLESHFNEDVIFYKDVRIHGELKANFSFLKNISLIVKNLNVLDKSIFDGDSYFGKSLYVEENINAGIVTARDGLDVGCGGTTLRANVSTGKVGIGSTVPQQKLDIAGSAKIDETIYDSVNAPGQNGYFLTRDSGGLRWLPLIADSVPGVPGISTDGIFILDEGVPLNP